MESEFTGISVLMAVCDSDRSTWLDAALNSLERQRRLADEVVLVEDGPLPAPIVDVIDAYTKSLRIRKVTVANRSGLGNALSVGLEVCQGELVARMDADDICEPERFAAQADCFKREPGLSVVGSTAVVIDEQGKKAGDLKVPATPEGIRDKVWACPFVHPSVMFRRSAILDVGGYDRRLKTRQDYDLWFRCVAAKLHMRNLERPLIQYRVSRKPRNRRFSVVWRQAMIGWQGCRLLKASPKAWLAVGAPIVLCFLPRRASDFLRQQFRFAL